MQISIVLYLLSWWSIFFILGVSFLPITFIIFNNFEDRGYFFSKIIGLGVVSYFVFLLSLFKILPFGNLSISFSIILFAFISFGLATKYKLTEEILKKKKIIIFEEILFISLFIFWCYIRSFSPEINGLEKFMDFGFINSILRTSYFPPKDMWFTPLSINYYYFGHLYTALLTKISAVPSSYSYNFAISTIFSLTFVSSFSLGISLIKSRSIKMRIGNGILSALLTTFAGNLQIIYSFFKGYNVDHVVPFWNLIFSPATFPNDYWYPNATRFIPFTIHEFPVYSFVVSDLHGHVLDIPFVLLSIALIFNFASNQKTTKKYLLMVSFFLALMYMTNAWDGAIYFLLFFFCLIYKKSLEIKTLKSLAFSLLKESLLVLTLFVLFTLPFSINFKPFVSGIGVICAPDFLTNLGKIGPFLFEKNHCQTSPFWQLLTLYGFFYTWAILIITYWYKKRFKNINSFILILILLSTFLLIIPEFFYFKDIYPQHYRANTMFKLSYQAFILLSLVSSYSIITLLTSRLKWVFTPLVVFLLTLVFIYPKFAIYSYYKSLKGNPSLDGTIYLNTRYPDDYKVINWLNNKVVGQPVLLEAQGDSYTDYARISANTGLPTVLGWTVHEWLWRGTYSIPAPRIADIRIMYESSDLIETKTLFKKYAVKYVYIGNLERQKYTKLNDEKFKKLGKTVFSSGTSKLYRLN